jgi:hypothetical protein
VQYYKSNGFRVEQTESFLAEKAYGPGGVAYRGSEETEALLRRLARAGYERNPAEWKDKDGRSTQNFSEYAFSMCMSGTPF